AARYLASVGDACRPMLIFFSSGGRIEDAAAFSILFWHISSACQRQAVLHPCRALRYSRTTKTQLASRIYQKLFHLLDGTAKNAGEHLPMCRGKRQGQRRP
ncbi:hypothetical protein B0H19DRAFT_936662, partial [Mycena capillaripes]